MWNYELSFLCPEDGPDVVEQVDGYVVVACLKGGNCYRKAFEKACARGAAARPTASGAGYKGSQNELLESDIELVTLLPLEVNTQTEFELR